MNQLFSLLMSFLTADFLREPKFLLFIVFLLLSVFGRSTYRWIWFSLPLSCAVFWACPAVVDAIKKIMFPYTIDRLMDILADKQFVIDMLISKRAVRFSVVHCIMPEPQVIQPSIWAWFLSYILPLSSPEPMQEICMLTWSHSVHVGSLLACVLLLGFLVVCGVYCLCHRGGKLSNAVVENTQSLVVNGVGGASMV